MDPGCCSPASDDWQRKALNYVTDVKAGKRGFAVGSSSIIWRFLVLFGTSSK